MIRPEWSVIGGAALMLCSVIFCSAWAWHLGQVRDLVNSDLRELEAACIAFRQENNRYPTRFDVAYDYHFGLKEDVSNNEVINALTAQEGPGNEGNAVNPEKKPYLKLGPAGFRMSGLNQRGEFVDPWGSPYQLVLDLDGNRTCDLSATTYDRAIGKQAAVWSHGPDRAPNTRDDILGWTLREKTDEIVVTGSEDEE